MFFEVIRELLLLKLGNFVNKKSVALVKRENRFTKTLSSFVPGFSVQGMVLVNPFLRLLKRPIFVLKSSVWAAAEGGAKRIT